jgi:hypothetical protein
MPKLMLQQALAELKPGASAMTNSLEQTVPSKKNTCASHGVGAGVTGDGVGSGVTGEGLGGRVLHMSTYSQLPFMYDPAPKFMLQQIMTDV